MSTTELKEQIANGSPRFKARIAGLCYLLTIVLGILAFMLRGNLRFAADLLATACYIAAALLLYYLLKPVSKNLSLLAVCFSILGQIFQKLHLFPHLAALFVGLNFLMIGYLILRSIFLPRILGALIALAGVFWLTSLLPPLAQYLNPWGVLASGILGAGSLTLWLLVKGVNVQRWKEQANATEVRSENHNEDRKSTKLSQEEGS